MDRRKFLGTMVGGVGLGAAVRTWPFRVYSFPSQVSICTRWDLGSSPPYSIVYLSPGQILLTEDGKIWKNITDFPQTIRIAAGEIIGGNFAEIHWRTKGSTVMIEDTEFPNA